MMSTKKNTLTEKKHLTLAISPCPNDTFIFHALANRTLTLPDAEIDTAFEDVETLNQAALRGVYDISKLSFHAYLLVEKAYRLLRTGAALGYGCGPLLVSRERISPSEVNALSVLVPGELTTAHLLLRLFAPTLKRKRFVRYDKVLPMLLDGEADAGVIIHEDRFVYASKGLFKVTDLGSWWEAETGAPIPLGCIAMRRELADTYADRFDALVRKSIEAARSRPESVLPFIRAHAQQMDEIVLEKHIATFVNEYSFDLGAEGDSAIAALIDRGRRAGIVS